MPHPDFTEAERALLPFLAWAKPLYEPAQLRVLARLDALAAKHPNLLATAQLQISVRLAFARPILAASQRTLILELGIARHLNRLTTETPQSRFNEFIAWISSPAGRRHINKDYPFLRKDVILRARQIARFLLSMLRNIVKDAEKLARVCKHPPGRLLQFRTEMGDRHANGRSVVKLQFSHACIYYKPRSMAVDAAFSRLLGWLAEDGVQPDQRGVQVLDRGGYGYAVEVQFKCTTSDAELDAYYRRFGGLIAISYMLGTTDLHDENLIAVGAWPMIIDAETLFQPQPLARHGARGNRPAFANTVLHSGLLPTGSPGEEHHDVTALFMPQESMYERVPIDAGTDTMRLAVQRLPMPFSNNMARLNNQVVQPHLYVDAICAGFECTYRGLLERKKVLLHADGPLMPLRPLEVRVLVRPTAIYAHLLTMLSHPDYLQSEEKRTALLAHLHTSVDGELSVPCVWSAEREALLRGDVPYFSSGVDSGDVRDDQEQPLMTQYASSGWQESRRLLSSMSLHDLRRQSRLVHQAVNSTGPIDLNSAGLVGTLGNGLSAALASNDFVQEAARIADYILSTACIDHGHVRFFQLESRGHPVLRPFALNTDLYNGLSGLAIFFCELARTTGNARYKLAAKRTLASVRRDLARTSPLPGCIGAFCGMAGWIYTLALIGSRMGEDRLVQEALGLLPQLHANITDDRYLDVIGGSAGALLVLVALERLVPGKGAIEVARACAEHLLATAQTDSQGRVCWISTDFAGQHAMSGFSHGASGIAAGLAGFAAASGDMRFMDLGRAAMPFARTSFAPLLATQNTTGSQAETLHTAETMCAWCHGAPGAGLGLLLQPAAMRDRQWFHDLDSCVAITRDKGFSDSHCVCHGQLGNLELLMQTAIETGNSAAASQWRAIAAQLLSEGRSYWRTGSIRNDQSLGFMTGLAGIGYALLRINDPYNVPAVVSLQLQARPLAGAAGAPSSATHVASADWAGQ